LSDSYEIDQARLDELTACAEMFNSLMEEHASIPEIFAVTSDVVPKKKSEYSAIIAGGNGRIFVARKDDQPVAMAAVYTRHAPDYFHFKEHGFIADVYVQAQHRRKGLARQLAAACLDYLSQQGITTVRLTNSVLNDVADRTWDALGFKEVMKVRLLNVEDGIKEVRREFDDERIPCVDETCVGTIGPDGRCRYCGKPGPDGTK